MLVLWLRSLKLTSSSSIKGKSFGIRACERSLFIRTGVVGVEAAEDPPESERFVVEEEKDWIEGEGVREVRLGEDVAELGLAKEMVAPRDRSFFASCFSFFSSFSFASFRRSRCDLPFLGPRSVRKLNFLLSSRGDMVLTLRGDGGAVERGSVPPLMRRASLRNTSLRDPSLRSDGDAPGLPSVAELSSRFRIERKDMVRVRGVLGLRGR